MESDDFEGGKTAFCAVRGLRSTETFGNFLINASRASSASSFVLRLTDLRCRVSVFGSV